MEPVTATLAAIAAVKVGLKTAKDVQGIASSLDALFHHSSEIKKKAAQKEPSKLKQFLNRKTGETEGDDDSLSSVMTEVLEQKKIDREILNLGIQINNKFGPGVWQQILKIREGRVEKRKEMERVSQENKRRKADDSKKFWRKVLQETGKVLIVLTMLGLLAYFLMWAANNINGVNYIACYPRSFAINDHRGWVRRYKKQFSKSYGRPRNFSQKL